jgi:peroxiredoxin
MGHIRRNIAEVEKRGAGVAAVLAQDMQKVREYLEQNSYPFPLLVDENRSVIKDYGVYVKVNLESHNIARPSDFILDGRGIIRYIYVGYHQRDFPDDSELYEVLESFKTPAV